MMLSVSKKPDQGKKMNKTIESASLIDLKAELHRKKEEFKQEKLLQGNVIKAKPTEKKVNIWDRKNAGVLDRAQRDLEEKHEEEDVLEKSRKALEAKSNLYEKLVDPKNLTDESEESPYLVDFEQKAIDKYNEKRREKEMKENEKVEMEPPPSDPGEEWVDYVDSLGRTRRCMKKDLPKFMEMDRELGNEVGHCLSEKSRSEMLPDLLSSDMYRQMLREKWEKEEKEAMEKPTGPTHYENIRYDEVRNHGVGYFKFAKEEEERKQQMDALNKLRNQTESQRAQRERIKEKRKALKADRLKKVKMRKRMRMGLDPVASDNEENEISDEEPKEEVKEEEFIGPLPKDEKERPMREWDVGKTDKDSSWNWARQMEKLRDERPAEFAPPSSYNYEPYKPRSSNQDKKSQEFAPPADYFTEASSGSSHTSYHFQESNSKSKTSQWNSSEKNWANEFDLRPHSSESNIDQTLKFFKNASKS